MTLSPGNRQIGGRSGGAGGRLPNSDLWTLDFVPPLLDRNGFGLAQQRVGAGALTLTGALVASNGMGLVDADTESFGRCVGVYSAGNLSARTFTVAGYDYRGRPVVENLTGPNNSTTAGLKAFMLIKGWSVDGTIASDAELGTIEKYGLPMRLHNLSQIVRVGWSATLAENAATFVPGVATSPATAITGDVRGTVVPSSAADGTRRLTVVGVPVMSTRAEQYGVSQFGTGV